MQMIIVLVGYYLFYDNLIGLFLKYVNFYVIPTSLIAYCARGASGRGVYKDKNTH